MERIATIVLLVASVAAVGYLKMEQLDLRAANAEIAAAAAVEAAEAEAAELVEAAKTAIENEKSAAMKELQNTVVDLSLNIAEKLLSKELDNKEKQLENIQDILDKTKLN